MIRVLLASLAALALLTAGAISVAADEHADQATIERMWYIAERLACPVCEGQSVRESNAELARQMRDIIVARLQVGESEDRIFDFMAARYGPGILLDTPKRGLALGVWIGPIVALIAGALIVLWVLTHNRVRPAPAGAADLEPYEAQVDALRHQDSTPDRRP